MLETKTNGQLETISQLKSTTKHVTVSTAQEHSSNFRKQWTGIILQGFYCCFHRSMKMDIILCSSNAPQINI